MAKAIWKKKSRKWQKELISIILCAPSHRLKWWSGTHSSHCVVFVLRRSAFIVFSNTAAAMQITIIPSLVTCYLFFRCGIEKESLSWAFPQNSPPSIPTHPHTIFYRHISFLSLRRQLTQAFFFFDVWVEYILRDVVYPSCLTWFKVEVVPSCPSLVHYMFQKTGLESGASECSTYSIIQAFDGAECSCIY